MAIEPVRNYLDANPAAIDMEKRALLARIAEKGSEGQAEYDRQRAAIARARSGGLEAAAARGAAINAPAALQAELTQDYDALVRAVDEYAAAGALAHSREMDRIAAANAAYLDQAATASGMLQQELDAQIQAAIEVAKLSGSGGGRGGGGRGGRGGGGGGGGGSGFGGFGSGADLELMADMTPNEVANALAEEYAFAVRSGVDNGQARRELLGRIDEAVAMGLMSPADAQIQRERVSRAMAAVDQGRAVTSTADLYRRSAQRSPGIDFAKIDRIARAILAGQRYSGTPEEIAAARKWAAKLRKDMDNTRRTAELGREMRGITAGGLQRQPARKNTRAQASKDRSRRATDRMRSIFRGSASRS